MMLIVSISANTADGTLNKFGKNKGKLGACTRNVGCGTWKVGLICMDQGRNRWHATGLTLCSTLKGR